MIEVGKTNSALQILSLLLVFLIHCQASTHYNWVKVKEATYTRLCSTKKILTVNGKFPGPVLQAHKGDTIYVNVHNKGSHNITIHWHGVKQPRNPWSDGPEYITQCPIQPGDQFKQTIIFSNEEGTIWWHAHNDWARATVHGAIFVYPTRGASYPFPKPHEQVQIILGQWWRRDVREVLEEFIRTGGAPNVSDAHTINGQPGDLYPCSKSVLYFSNFFIKSTSFCRDIQAPCGSNKTYLLRIVNAAMNTIFFYSIANHNLTVVGVDGSYTKPVTTDYMTISPGQTLDALLITNQQVGQYYMAARAYSNTLLIPFDNTTTTTIGENLPLLLQVPKRGTKVRVFKYGSIVELVFQGTNLGAPIDHPIHLHGFSFYIVGWGFGNFDKDKDPLNYNLIDPPLRNTVAVPISGRAAIRFHADNPEH
ncbi:unnamed protein product [Prunus armeniaca]|uniref:laccase n=1 Tax=Prunus armeniaca TaxID=36596 RepID=A0A6J5VP53_PRUAR|nr:unnamed protein product [Prunus armeniaca]